MWSSNIQAWRLRFSGGTRPQGTARTQGGSRCSAGSPQSREAAEGSSGGLGIGPAADVELQVDGDLPTHRLDNGQIRQAGKKHTSRQDRQTFHL